MTGDDTKTQGMTGRMTGDDTKTRGFQRRRIFVSGRSQHRAGAPRQRAGAPYGGPDLAPKLDPAGSARLAWLAQPGRPGLLAWPGLASRPAQPDRAGWPTLERGSLHARLPADRNGRENGDGARRRAGAPWRRTGARPAGMVLEGCCRDIQHPFNIHSTSIQHPFNIHSTSIQHRHFSFYFYIIHACRGLK